MTDEEKKFIKEINIDKAKNKTIAPIFLISFSILTYVFPLIFGEFDFGIVFEIMSLVFLIIARFYMLEYDVIRSKRYIICSMVAVGWILIYDIMFLYFYVQNIVDFTISDIIFFLGEFFTIVYLIILFLINKDLSKADNPERYKESTDWFYEKYEENENKEKNSRKVQFYS